MKTNYKFIGDYNRLRDLDYIRMKFLENDDGYQIWGKVLSNCSITIYDYVSVKIFRGLSGVTYTDPNIIEPYIKELIENKLVKEVFICN